MHIIKEEKDWTILKLKKYIPPIIRLLRSNGLDILFLINRSLMEF